MGILATVTRLFADVSLIDEILSEEMLETVGLGVDLYPQTPEIVQR